MNRDRAELAAQFLREQLSQASTYDTLTNRRRDDMRADVEELIDAGIRTLTKESM